MKVIKTLLYSCIAMSFWIHITYPSAVFFGEVSYPREN